MQLKIQTPRKSRQRTRQRCDDVWVEELSNLFTVCFEILVPYKGLELHWVLFVREFKNQTPELVRLRRQL